MILNYIFLNITSDRMSVGAFCMARRGFDS